MKFTPAQFDELIKVLETVKGTSIVIKDGKMSQSLGTAIVEAECPGVPDLQIADSSLLKYLKGLKETNSDIEIIDDEVFYIFTNGELTVRIPKPDNVDEVKSFDLSGLQKCDSFQIDEKLANLIAQYTKDTQVNICLKNDEILGFTTDLIAVSVKPDVPSLNIEEEAEKKVVSKTFMPIKIKSVYTFELFKNSDDYILSTETIVGDIKIRAIELLQSGDTIDVI